MNIAIILVIELFFFSCKNKGELRIYQIPKSENIDTSKNENEISINRTRYFLISGDLPDRDKLLSVVDNFVASNCTDSSQKFYRNDMMFFKESTETNLHNIEEDPNKLDDAYAQEHDLIFFYSCRTDRPALRTEFREGNVINSDGHATFEHIHNVPNPERTKAEHKK